MRKSKSKHHQSYKNNIDGSDVEDKPARAKQNEKSSRSERRRRDERETEKREAKTDTIQLNEEVIKIKCVFIFRVILKSEKYQYKI